MEKINSLIGFALMAIILFLLDTGFSFQDKEKEEGTNEGPCFLHHCRNSIQETVSVQIQLCSAALDVRSSPQESKCTCHLLVLFKSVGMNPHSLTAPPVPAMAIFLPSSVSPSGPEARGDHPNAVPVCF